jgi:hypothetical protein
LENVALGGGVPSAPRSLTLAELVEAYLAQHDVEPAPGYRFDATQALRQVLARAVVSGMIDISPAKLGVDNPSPRRREQRPFESWAELDATRGPSRTAASRDGVSELEGAGSNQPPRVSF